MHSFLKAYENHKDDAHKAFEIYKHHCRGNPPPRVPGMDTAIRLALRIANGRTVDEAAAKEYLYRWHLAIKTPDQCLDTASCSPCVSIFGVPHAIGL